MRTPVEEMPLTSYGDVDCRKGAPEGWILGNPPAPEDILKALGIQVLTGYTGCYQEGSGRWKRWVPCTTHLFPSDYGKLLNSAKGRKLLRKKREAEEVAELKRQAEIEAAKEATKTRAKAVAASRREWAQVKSQAEADLASRGIEGVVLEANITADGGREVVVRTNSHRSVVGLKVESILAEVERLRCLPPPAPWQPRAPRTPSTREYGAQGIRWLADQGWTLAKSGRSATKDGLRMFLGDEGFGNITVVLAPQEGGAPIDSRRVDGPSVIDTMKEILSGPSQGLHLALVSMGLVGKSA